MQYNIYVIYDRVAKIHYTPFYQQNDDQAKRTFLTMAEDTTTPIYSSPEDFDLIHIGYYDNESGHLTGDISELILRGAINKLQPELKEVATNA